MKKNRTIQAIEDRIKAEHRKHPQLDWAEIAAFKIYASFIKEAEPFDIGTEVQFNDEWYKIIRNNEMYGEANAYRISGHDGLFLKSDFDDIKH